MMCATFLMAGAVHAREQVLATISSDDNKGVFNFVANIDDKNQNIKGFFKDNYNGGNKTAREALDVRGINREGVVLDKRGDHTVINLRSNNFDLERGGAVVIDTLFNGVTGERKGYEVELSRSGDTWKLFNRNTPVSKLFIEVNKKPIVGTVGIKNIRMQ